MNTFPDAEPVNIALTVLAIDPGTNYMGAAIVQFAPSGCPAQAWTTHFDATHIRGSDEAAKFDRIADLRRKLAEWISRSLDDAPIAIDVRAYEAPYADFELAQAIGAFMSLHALESLPCENVTRQTACITAGCFPLFRESTKTMTAAQKRDKQVRLKKAVMGWAGEWFENTDAATRAAANEHCADALAVAQAVFNAHAKAQAAEAKAERDSIKPLFGSGSRGPRKMLEAIK